ncbi:MAG: EAL domain-containing protein, partial [Rhodocyclaceae bacterium]|nr:EAL domain-containing protein [Rhodocyclaceae bacterium]
MSDPLIRRPAAVALAVIAVLVAALVLSAWSVRGRVPILANLEGQWLDFQHRLRGPLPPGSDPRLAIVLVDDRSLQELGRLPVPRSVLARALSALGDAGASRVVVDMLLVEPGRDGDGEDARLAEAMRTSGKVLLPFALVAHGGGQPSIPERLLDGAYLRYRNEARLSDAPLQPSGLIAPLPLLAGAAAALGNVSVQRGHDGSLRFDMPVQALDGELFPTLAVRTAAELLSVPWADVEARVGEAIVIGPRQVPLDAASRQWVNYYGPEGSFPTFSLADLLAGRLDPGALRGHTVLLGGSALGSSDRYPSPFDPSLPGVERLATVIDNIVTGRWLERPAWAAAGELAAIVLLPFLSVAVIARARPVRAFALLAGLAVVLLVVAQVLFASAGSFVSMAFPLVALVLSGGLGMSYRALMDERSRREAEQRLRASEERYALSAQGANDGLWDWDIDGHGLYCSPRWRELMGIPADEPLGGLDDWVGRLDQLERDRFTRELDAHLSGATRQFHHLYRHQREGEERWFLARAAAVRRGNRAVRLAGSISDMTEQKRLEHQIAHDALHDRLTGLPNRALLLDRVEQWLATTRLPGGGVEPVGTVLIDLDGFLEIEKAHGQLGCNALLKGFATRLGELAGGVWPVAHLGGDQFALAYRGAQSDTLEGRVQALLDAPFDLAGRRETVGATIGVAHSSQGLESAAELLGAAMLAVSAGKRDGRGALHRYDPDKQALEDSRQRLADDIRLALAAGDQFELHYQPFVRLSDRSLLGFEALIRWQHPERGNVMPGEFIPFAEQTGLINEIGAWTLREAARQLVAWDQAGFDGEIAVNLSGRQFTETDLEADARDLLAILGDVAPARLKLEVTESMSMSNPQHTTDILNKLVAMGFKISIDDFGTGYSSLAYLHRFPFNTLKIDRSFVIRLDAGREAQEIVRTIAGLAGALGKQVLAEGVEEESQAKVLLELGTEVGQGWLFAKALPAVRARDWFVGNPPPRP